MDSGSSQKERERDERRAAEVRAKRLQYLDGEAAASAGPQPVDELLHETPVPVASSTLTPTAPAASVSSRSALTTTSSETAPAAVFVVCGRAAQELIRSLKHMAGCPSGVPPLSDISNGQLCISSTVTAADGSRPSGPQNPGKCRSSAFSSDELGNFFQSLPPWEPLPSTSSTGAAGDVNVPELSVVEVNTNGVQSACDDSTKPSNPSKLNWKNHLHSSSAKGKENIRPTIKRNKTGKQQDDSESDSDSPLKQLLGESNSSSSAGNIFPSTGAIRKRGRGRPKGSRNKAQSGPHNSDSSDNVDFPRSIPLQDYNWRESLPSTSAAKPSSSSSAGSKRGPGRPKGSRNKSKLTSLVKPLKFALCHICEEEQEGAEVCVTDCGHFFHKVCLSRWTRASSKKYNDKQCPFCGSSYNKCFPFFG
ncbi:Protein TRC8-like protein [Frankliniella fusca]|uniref:Protein TRC8-like protein n=1 Tax=Frankliniella fusca TaxID=407009 RepID=A0AAE1HNX7_9NEOP|nr:Protein TRC8-like protein [Frankliniella fusca]